MGKIAPEEAAALIALLFKRSGLRRARVSLKTVRRVSGRTHIRTAFIQMLKQHLDDLGLSMSELDRGGYGLMPASALEGAPAITVKKYLAEDLKRFKHGDIDINEIRSELDDDSSLDDDEAE